MSAPTLDLIRAKDDIIGTISRYIDLRKKGDEFVACCPFHDEKSPSFTVTPATGYFFCFGCGEGGDAIDFVQKYEGVGFNAAVGQIVGNHTGEASPVRHQPTKSAKAADEWKLIAPIPDDTPPPKFTFRGMQATRTWLYRDEAGGRIGYVCRFDKPEGGKEVVPLARWVNTSTGEMAWRFAAFPKPRPLYGLDRLAANPTAQVLIVEGEKTADAAQKLFRDAGANLVVVSWPGGGKAVRYVDWSPLKGRRVGLWPDADQKTYPEKHELAGELMPFIEQPGTVAMVDVAAALDGLAEAVKFIMPPEGVPDGWDLADELPLDFELLAHSKSAALKLADFRIEYGLGCQPAAETLEPAGDAVGALAATTEPTQPVAEFEEGLLPEPANENEPVSLVTANDNANIDVHDLQPVNPFEWPNLSSKSQPLNTIPNLRRLLDNYGFTVRYDVIRKDLVIRYPGQSGTQDNSRETAVNTVVSLCALNRLPKADAPGFLLNIGDANLVNPVMDFITSHPWDGRSRFNELIDTVQTREGYDRGLFAMLLRRWLISAVAAAAKPSGFWSKGVLVFQGEQSLGKTAWIRSLLPEGLRDLIKIDATINPDNKDTIISAVSHWICELGELDGTLRKADIARLKGFISQDVDQFRRPYARTEGKYGRRTVFFASVNPEQFLADDTGNVRWWTVPVTRVNSQHSIDMQQLWAEVFEWLNAGERWWLERDEEGALEIVNDNHRHIDPIEEIILGAYDCNASRDRKLAASDVLREIGFEKPTTGQSRTASKVLKAMFGEPKKNNGRLVFTMPPRIEGHYRRYDDEYPI